jgi:hypothetical protein
LSAVVTQTRTPARRRHGKCRPFRQGDLDGLCGVYSVINAVRVLCPEVDRATAEHVFDLLLQRVLREAGNPSVAVTWGVGRLMVMRLIGDAATYLRDEFDIRLKARRLPKAVRARGSRDVLWQALESALSPTCIAIVGLAGRHSHWTVATHVTPLSLHLFDSCRLQALPRARCTVRRTLRRHQVMPMHVVLVERST